MTDEIDAMRAENERLRGERDYFREAWAAAQVRIDCGSDAVEAVREERAAVAAWLRGRQEATEWALTAAGYEHAADTIERGEHRRGEEKP